ncbi:Serine/threonine-protein kinase AfsK [Streptomyces hundungensis]|uniref:Serine/threonine-protein kinase AfsK n=1 Tax=Streptomyces hundungensis TaxID=1077946 RepID=A0A387HCH9_9ACTN|nr:serine/threonine-protein kinase [Streptomyces hundungensis]AYG81536.1 Serine/threonine-protein kinase AfsK [Streptomyces hundungensis]
MDTLRPSQDPERIGTYALLARLGAGGMGMVYLGRSPGGRLVAIKVIKDEITDHPEALTRFRREAETVRAVRGAYTANLIDASLSAPPYWLATEYVAGPTLSHAVRERGAFPADTCLRLFAALAEGLASVHGYGVTHRDLKPQNVILSPQGPQLIDFGIAKGAEDTALTRTGLAPGTPGFTAPEVLMRNQVGAAADVFALGATIAFAATGRAPFGSGPMDAVSYRAVHEEIDLVGVEPRLAALIRACAAKDPAERPRPAEIIALCAVGSALSEDPHYLALGSLGEEVPETAMRGPHDMPTAGPGYVPTRSPSQAGYVPTLAPQGMTAPHSRSRRRPWLIALAVTAVLGVTAAVAVRLLPDGKDGAQAQGSGKGPSAGDVSPGLTGSPQPVGDQTPKGPPQFIEQTAPSGDSWSGKDHACVVPSEEAADLHFQYSVTAGDDSLTDGVPSGKARIGYRLKYEDPGLDPYYLSVAVKPPHELDAQGHATTKGPNRQLGMMNKVTNMYAPVQTDWKYFTYPDDFVYRSGGKEFPAIALSADPGEWTVTLRHVKSVKDYKSVVCDGFMAE